MKKWLLGLFLMLSFIFCFNFVKVVNAEEEKEDVQEVVEEINENKGFWETVQEKVLTPETMALITLIIGVVASLLKALGSIKALKIKNELTLANVQETLQNALKEQTEQELSKAIEDLTKPLAKEVNNMKPVLDTFAKVLALSQENTPNSKLAILELLSQLGNVELIEEAKQEVVTQEQEKIEKKEQVLEELKKIEMPVE